MENFCKTCSRYHPQEIPCHAVKPFCSHGQLARQCRLCELEAEVAVLKKDISRINTDVLDREREVAILELEVTRMRPVFDAAREWAKSMIEFDDSEWEGTESIGDIAKDKRFNELCQLLGTGERALIAAVRKLDR